MAEIQVKICGITNQADAQVAVEAGADLLGFILYPKSPRFITPAQASVVISEIKAWVNDQPGVTLPRFVGVFVNEPAEQVAQILESTHLDYAQLHGEESLAVLQKLAPRAFKALRPSNAEAAASDAAQYGPLGTPDGPQLLIDAYDPHTYGGTGHKADWHTAAALAKCWPRLLLAGGLTPQNVAQAVRTVRPWGVDVASGVEDAPGRKDHTAVRNFIQNAREAAR